MIWLFFTNLKNNFMRTNTYQKRGIISFTNKVSHIGYKLLSFALLLFCLIFCTSIETLTAQTIYTYAGTSTLGYSGDGGAATLAQINDPFGVQVDGYGNLYICDLGNNVIRKVNVSGVISTVAGNFTLGAGYSGDGGQATAAQLNGPTDIAVDGSGNLYIADVGNEVIRKVAPSGIITTVAGNYALGAGYNGDGILATNAQLNSPFGIGLDGSGNLYIADGANNRIRMVSSGTISTVAGNGTSGYFGDGGAALSRNKYP
jgi:hypothetical protein